MSGTRLRLFGPLSLEIDGVPSPRPTTTHSELLLASLAVANGRPLSRALLTERIWPDRDPAKARHSLSQALTTLRSSLPPHSIHTHPGGLISLNVEDWFVDVLEFRRLAELGSQDAFGLFMDDFLSHLDHPWVAAEQSSLARVLTELYDEHEAALSEEAAERVRRILNISVVAPPHVVRDAPLNAGRFFGRQAELAEITRLLSEGTRLITLIAPGGFGKSRLAAESARLGRFDGFVSLADAPHDVDVRELVKAWSPCDRIVLDNCEHLGDAALASIQTLIEEHPSLQILATSRKSLRIAGEREVQLSPLGSAPKSQAPADIVRWDSLQLLMDRAEISASEIETDGETRQVLMEICQKLEGVPLALELVAQRLRRRSASEVLALLNHHLSTVETSQANRPQRHHSLLAALDGSLDSLSQASRSALSQLSVIPSGFEISLAEAILGDEAEERLDILNRAGLLRRDRLDGAPWFRLLDLVRERVAELSSEDVVQAEKSFVGWVRTRIEQDRPNLIGPDAERHLRAWDRRRETLRKALSRATDEVFLSFVLSTGRYWVVRGLAAEGREWFEKGCDLPAEHSVKADFWESLGVLRTNAGDHEAAADAIRKCIQMKEQIGDEPGVIRAQINLTSVLRNMGRSDEVIAVLENVLPHPILTTQPHFRSIALSTYANALIDEKRDDEAMNALDELIELRKQLKDTRGLLLSRGNRAFLQLRRGQVHDAFADLRDVLLALIRAEDWVPAGDFLITLANLMTQIQRWTTASEVLGIADASYDRAGAVPIQPNQEEIIALSALCREKMGLEFDKLHLRGRRMEPQALVQWLEELTI